MDNSERANTKNSRVKRGRGGRWAKGTPSPNPAGRPPLGESWREIFDKAGKLTKQELMALYPVYGKRLEGLPNDVPLRDAVALSALVTLACEPSPGLLSAIMERVDGKVITKIEVRDWREAAKQSGLDPEKVLNEFEDVIASKMGNRANGDGGDAEDTIEADAPDVAGGVSQP